MNTETEIEHYKCGYCEWLLDSNCEISQHVCFSEYDEDIHEILYDDNFVITFVPRSQEISQEITEENSSAFDEELLISYVASRRALYDHRIPLQERTHLKKGEQWSEIYNLFQGKVPLEEIKAKWKYLRDCYVKARKKVKKYIPSGIARDSQLGESGFRHYMSMLFLNDILDNKPTISNIVSSNKENELVSPPTSSQPSPLSTQNTSTPTVKRKRQERNLLEEAITETLRAPLPQLPKPDEVDGFLIMLGAGLRRLPVRSRTQLQIKYLTLLYEEEQQNN